MTTKIILDLCGGSGSWSKPYKNNGYDVRLITLPEYNVLTYQPPPNVWGILASPPCHDFSVSGAQYWIIKDIYGITARSLQIFDACINIITNSNPEWWCLENPVGRIPTLRPFMGKPVYIQPHFYGDPYTKKTGLWGNFNLPPQNNVEPIRYCKQGSWLQQLGGNSEKTKYLRSLTPPGFALAFYRANP